MWLLVTFIIIWALSPGPVAVMTLHESRKKGLMAGVAVSGGATATSIIMVIAALLLYFAGISTLLESPNMMVIERIGAFGIIFMGLYAGYKSLLASNEESTGAITDTTTKFGFAKGMTVMATYIPQALIFYNLIVPQTVEPQAVITTIVALGILKVVLIFGWHAGIAFVSTRSQGWIRNNRFSKILEVSTAVLIIGLGVNILF